MSLKTLLNKSISVLLIATSICLPTLGETTTEKKVLPLKEAVKSSISYSKNLKLLEKKSDTNRYILDHSDTMTYTDQDLAIKTRQNDQNTTFFKDKLEYLTENLYNQIITTNLSLELLDKQIASTQKDVDVLKLQLSHGYTDELTLKSKESDLEKMQNKKLTAEATLVKVKQDFKMLTNIDPNNYTFENPIEYEPFRAKDSITAYINIRLGEMTKFSKEYADYFDSSLAARVTSSENSEISERQYADAVYERQANYDNMAIQSDNNFQALMGQYTSLIDKEKAIDNTKLEIETLDKTIAATKLKLDKGLVTEIEYNKLLLQKEELENTLTSTIYQHQELKRILDKPWVTLM